MIKYLEGNIITIKEDLDWLDVKILTVAVPVFDKTNKSDVCCILLLHLSIPSIDERLKPLQQIFMYTMIGSAFIATLLSLLLSRSLVKPLLKINKAAFANV
jgi:hypothetical protein